MTSHDHRAVTGLPAGTRGSPTVTRPTPAGRPPMASRDERPKRQSDLWPGWYRVSDAELGELARQAARREAGTAR